MSPAPRRHKPDTGNPSAVRIAPLSEEIARRIRARRRSLNMSQEQLARAVGVSRQTVSNWECARTIPDALALGDIAVACGTTADDLLGNGAPQMRRVALAARRELLTALSIVLLAQMAGMIATGLQIGAVSPIDDRAFAAFRLGVLVVGGLWVWRVARREGLATVRQMIDFASLASKQPGGIGDRALRFTGRWFWTLWFVLSSALCGAGVLVSMAVGASDTSALIGPAFMLLVATIPFTWERNAR